MKTEKRELKNEKRETRNEIIQQFSKHYKRIVEDFDQISGTTPLMKKILSFNLKNLENDVVAIFENNEERNNEHGQGTTI